MIAEMLRILGIISLVIIVIYFGFDRFKSKKI